MTLSKLARAFFIAVVAFTLSTSPALAKGTGGTVHVKGYTKKDGTHVAPHDRKAPKATSEKADKPPKTPAVSSASNVQRDADGRISRSAAAKHTFEIETGYPRGRQGYVIDHIVPLACGGPDAPSNMQWQTIADAKAKDKVERRGCSR